MECGSSFCIRNITYLVVKMGQNVPEGNIGLLKSQKVLKKGLSSSMSSVAFPFPGAVPSILADG